MKSLIKKIKQKKELSGLADSVVKETLQSYLKKHNISLTKTTHYTKKILVKEIRAQLRKLTGRFQKGIKNKENLPYKELLKTHSSTAERIDFYPKLKRRISKINPKTILDLGCGLNPIALASKKTKYYASDIKEDELKIIKKFFKEKNIKGKTFIQDLRNPPKKFPKADICLILKVFDILEENKKKRIILTQKILKALDCKTILVSFPTKKLSGKKMNNPKRIWFENILINKKFKTFASDNEIFYLILEPKTIAPR